MQSPTVEELFEVIANQSAQISELLQIAKGERMYSRIEAAREMGVSYSTICRHQRAIGFEPGNKKSKVNKNQLTRFFNRGVHREGTR